MSSPSEVIVVVDLNIVGLYVMNAKKMYV